MRFPITLKRDPNIIYYWEKNEWYRKHGYAIPVDFLLIIQWICSAALDVAFFCFIVYFISNDRNFESDSTMSVTYNYLLETYEKYNLAELKPLQSRNFYIMIGLSGLVKILSVLTSIIETEDPIVSDQRNEVSRSKIYVRRYAVPVIDSFSGVCGICRIKVSKSTRHCKLCNKCVGGMDHHCRWLNCCIGESNYSMFFLLISSAFAALLWYTYLAGYVVWLCLCQKETFIIYAFGIFNMKTVEKHISIEYFYYTSSFMALFVTFVALVSFVSITRLLVFHIKLASLNMTTIEYLNLPSREKSGMFDSDDEDYYSSDSETDDGGNVWNRTASTKKHKFPLYHIVTRKFRRSWIALVQTVIPSYRYRRLNSSKGGPCTSLCCFSLKKPQLLLTVSGKKNPKSKRNVPRHQARDDDIDMKEFFATKTIRPIIRLDEDEEGPDYTDDMGLDFSVLDNEGLYFENEHGIQISSPKNTSKRISKAAKILDMSEQEAALHIQTENAHSKPKSPDQFTEESEDLHTL